MALIPFNLMRERLDVAREESDTALFFHLLYFGEMIVKLTAAGLVAAIADDRDRHRYRQVYKLVRTDSIGDWSSAIDDILTGPTSQFLVSEARVEQKELTQRNQQDTWQHESVRLLHCCLEEVDPQHEKPPAKIDGRRWYSLFAEFRNKTRGHGAPQGVMCSKLAPALERSINLIVDNFHLWHRHWAYLYRNLSKKYRITRISEQPGPFDYLRSDGTPKFENGVYVHFDSHARVELVYSNPDAADFFFPNGAFSDKRFELISYISDNKQSGDATPYLAPATELPPSETHGSGVLDVQGDCFANLPAQPANYVRRPPLEDELFQRLMDERHPVITVRGAGGIGKTSLAITVLHRIASEGRYGAIAWFSARDIDLLTEGPKDVKPNVLTEQDIAREFATLLPPSNPDTKPATHLAESLTKSPISDPILFVFDNFETVRSPGTLFSWIDTYISKAP